MYYTWNKSTQQLVIYIDREATIKLLNLES